MRAEGFRRPQHPRRLNVEGPQPRPFGVRHIENRAIRREPAAIRTQERKRELDNLRSIRQGVIDPSMVTMTRIGLTEVGEIEATMPIEHQVIRRRELVPVAGGIQRGGFPRLRVNALDGPTRVVGVRALPHRRAFDIPAPAVVAQIERAVRANRQAVWATPRVREHAGTPIREHPRAATVADFGQHHRAIMADHWTFRETEPRGKNGDFTHAILLLMDGVPSRLAVLGMLGAGTQCYRLCPCIVLDCTAYESMISGVSSALRDLL